MTSFWTNIPLSKVFLFSFVDLTALSLLFSDSVFAESSYAGSVDTKLLGTFAAVRAVLHGLRRSRFVDRRLGGQPTCKWGICHLLGKYAVARPVWMQRRPVSRPGQQGFVLDDNLVE